MRWEFHPVAVCTVCGWPTSREHLHLVGESCERRTADGFRCTGVNTITMNPKDWRRCVLCGGSGRINERRCDLCHGTGWEYHVIPKRS
jgi:DnaJ-class molecular chaperone